MVQVTPARHDIISKKDFWTTAGQGIVEAKQLFTTLDEPTREQKVLRSQLEKIQPLRIH